MVRTPFLPKDTSLIMDTFFCPIGIRIRGYIPDEKTVAVMTTHYRPPPYAFVCYCLVLVVEERNGRDLAQQ